jgi:mono/diheme cytochrome c family protein
MMKFVILLALAGLAACHRNGSEDGKAPASAKPAALSFEGADYKDDAAKIAHGKRLTEVLHCNACHGDNLQGTNVSAGDPDFGDMNAPNITLLLAKYSDSDFDQLLRHGKPKDGREFWFMPVESYQFLSDGDLAAIVAYLRTFKPAGEQLPPIRKGKGFNAEVEKGLLAEAQAQIRRFATEAPNDLGPQHARGRDLARTVCTGCHNSKLQGYEGFTPDLDIAGAFTPAELETLLTTGKGKSKPDLGLMKNIVLSSLSKLTPAERQAIIAYLKARADQPQPAGAN